MGYPVPGTTASPRVSRRLIFTLGAFALLGLVADGLTGALVMCGLVVLVVGTYAVLTGRRTSLARNRKGGAGAVAAAFALIATGGALADTPPLVEPAPTTAQATTPDPAPSPAAPSEAPAPTSSEPTTSEPTTPEPTSGAPAETATSPAPAVAEAEPAVVAAPGTALAALADLEVKGRAPKTGYDRDRFAYRSHDLDRNGCDVRNDILRRDLDDIVIKHGTQGCVVETGTLTDPYSGDAIDFVRGGADGGGIEIDHVVALSDAWQKGAQAWDEDVFRTFGNDPLNLLAVRGSLNAQKGAGDAATWLPPNKDFRCAYVARQVAVKQEYDLWVTTAEHDAIRRILTGCPDEPLPVSEFPPLAPELAGPAPAPTLAPNPEPAPPAAAPAPIVGPAPTQEPAPATDPRFDTCKAAKAAGYGPYVEGKDPEYAWYRDADKDGAVCE